jgi:hypothetical protein
MPYYSEAAVERAMKVREVILRAVARKITWIQAAEISGVTPRHRRRRKEKYERFGFHALFDGRRGKTSPRRVPAAVLDEVLRLYREQYFDLNVEHFHEKLTAGHGFSALRRGVQRQVRGRGCGRRHGLPPLRARRPRPRLLPPARAGGGTRRHRELRPPDSPDRAAAVALDLSGLPGAGL